MALAVHPYYRERREYGSPPLGVRTGLIAFALIPLTFATVGKVNIITLLTGLGHEKLNAFHRHTAYIMLYVSVIHTVPFLVQPYSEGGAAGLHAAFTVLPSRWSRIHWHTSTGYARRPLRSFSTLVEKTGL